MECTVFFFSEGYQSDQVTSEIELLRKFFVVGSGIYKNEGEFLQHFAEKAKLAVVIATDFVCMHFTEE